MLFFPLWTLTKEVRVNGLRGLYPLFNTKFSGSTTMSTPHHHIKGLALFLMVSQRLDEFWLDCMAVARFRSIDNVHRGACQSCPCSYIHPGVHGLPSSNAIRSYRDLQNPLPHPFCSRSWIHRLLDAVWSSGWSAVGAGNAEVAWVRNVT